MVRMNYLRNSRPKKLGKNILKKKKKHKGNHITFSNIFVCQQLIYDWNLWRTVASWLYHLSDKEFPKAELFFMFHIWTCGYLCSNNINANHTSYKILNKRLEGIIDILIYRWKFSTDRICQLDYEYTYISVKQTFKTLQKRPF